MAAVSLFQITRIHTSTNHVFQTHYMKAGTLEKRLERAYISERTHELRQFSILLHLIKLCRGYQLCDAAIDDALLRESTSL